ncbi:TlpA family protein disulfide reductase, partial [bacterium]|nr:TlpA family protein disulfide reductase [bacterium]
SNSYYLNQDVVYQHPAYMELFIQVFEKYFQYLGRENGGKIYNDVNNKKSYASLTKTLSESEILSNDTLQELVVLKCIYDEFYDDKFSRSGMLNILDSLIDQSTIEKHKELAKRIRYRVTKLMIGHQPPKFSLYDKDSASVSLTDFDGKYVYLGFCTTVSYACIQEFEKLIPLFKNHKDHFEIVMVCVDESLAQMKQFVEQKEYPWLFLHYGNKPEIIKDYDIRAYPTYYFIDKEGKLVMSPAPNPDNKIEEGVFNLLRERGDL